MDSIITAQTDTLPRSLGTLSLSGLIFQYITGLDATPKTRETYYKDLRAFAKFLYVHQITEPTREDILSFKEELRATGKKPSTIQNYIEAVKLFFKWTAQENIYPDISQAVKGAKVSKDHKKDALTSAQAKLLLQSIERETVKGLRDYTIICLMITGGLRDIEISRANVEDLRTSGDSPVLYVQGKGREDRTEYVKLPAETDRAIREYLKARGHCSPEDPLFVSTSNNRTGERITTRSISSVAKTRLKAAGFDSDKLTAHSLRHTAVTLALLNGENIEDVKQFARHANIATTMIYNHAIDVANNTCAASIAAAVF